MEEEEEIVRRAQATSSARERRSNQCSVGADVQFRTPPKQVKRRRFSDSALVIQVGDDDESGNGFGLMIDISDNLLGSDRSKKVSFHVPAVAGVW